MPGRKAGQAPASPWLQVLPCVFGVKGTSAAWRIKTKTTCVQKWDPCYTTGQGAGGDIFPQCSCFCCPLSLGSSSGSQPHPGAPCGSAFRARIRLLCTNTRQRQLFPSPRVIPPKQHPGGRCDTQQGAGRGQENNSKILLNERPMKSLQVLSLAALNKSLQTPQQK